MHRTYILERLDDKETKGCYRFGFINGDSGLSTVYLRKESCEGKPPRRIKVTITEAP